MVPLLRASWLRVDVTGVLGVRIRIKYVIQSPHWHFRWRCNNNRRRNTFNGGRVISSAYSENDEKTRETISEAGL